MKLSTRWSTFSTTNQSNNKENQISHCHTCFRDMKTPTKLLTMALKLTI